MDIKSLRKFIFPAIFLLLLVTVLTKLLVYMDKTESVAKLSLASNQKLSLVVGKIDSIKLLEATSASKNNHKNLYKQYKYQVKGNLGQAIVEVTLDDETGNNLETNIIKSSTTKNNLLCTLRSKNNRNNRGQTTVSFGCYLHLQCTRPKNPQGYC